MTQGRQRRVACIVGTRPEAIKMAPIILELKKSSAFDVMVICTGQHRELALPILKYFGITVDFFFDDVMKAGQPVAQLTAALLNRIDEVIGEIKPDILLAQGDTTTVLASSLIAYYRQIDFGHVEAGLRTGNMRRPFPEEMNRVVAARMATWHFCPTERAAENLRREGIDDGRIYVVGNSVVDALKWTEARVLNQGTDPNASLENSGQSQRILLTVHRRESFGAPAQNIFEAIKRITLLFPAVRFCYPVHPNPSVRSMAYEALGHISAVELCEPLSYPDLVREMMRSQLVLTDSGGLQEEASVMGRPVLVLREETERMEVIDGGAGLLIGTDTEKIVESVSKLMMDHVVYQKMANARDLFGVGDTSRSVRAVLEQHID